MLEVPDASSKELEMPRPDGFRSTVNLDWVNLPKEAEELSLWSTLHDGDLAAIESDLLARTLTLRFDIGYVRDFHKLSEETRFVVIISGVQSVRSFSSVPWPGACSIPRGTSYEQQQ